jgi:CheY-like chemotaxis protein
LSAPDHRKLLLADDNESLLMALEVNLRRAGYRVIKALDGAAALAAAKEHLPDAVVSDLEMPEMDGIDFCKRLRQVPELMDIPFLFLTAHGDTDEKVAGLRCGADDYIVKPFEFEELIARIDLLLRNKRKLNRSQLCGKLEEISIFDVMQFLNLSGKEGTLHISAHACAAWISIQNGLIMDAAFGDQTGEDALIQILQLGEGAFDYAPNELISGTLRVPVHTAVMDATKLIDEGNLLSNLVPDTDSPLVLSEWPEERDEDIDRVCQTLADGPLTLRELGEACGLSRTRTGITVAKLVERGSVHCAAEPEPEVVDEEPLLPEDWEEAVLSAEAFAPDPASPVEEKEEAKESPEAESREALREPGKTAAAQTKAKQILFAFTDETAAMKVLSMVAEAFRSEKPKGFGRADIDFQRIQLPEGVLHLFSARGDKRLSFVWEPMLATSDATMFLAGAPADVEHLQYFQSKLNGNRPIPFAVVAPEPFDVEGVECRVIQSRGDVWSLFDELLGERPG